MSRAANLYVGHPKRLGRDPTVHRARKELAERAAHEVLAGKSELTRIHAGGGGVFRPGCHASQIGYTDVRSCAPGYIGLARSGNRVDPRGFRRKYGGGIRFVAENSAGGGPYRARIGGIVQD